MYIHIEVSSGENGISSVHEMHNIQISQGSNTVPSGLLLYSDTLCFIHRFHKQLAKDLT